MSSNSEEDDQKMQAVLPEQLGAGGEKGQKKSCLYSSLQSVHVDPSLKISCGSKSLIFMSLKLHETIKSVLSLS